MKMIAEYREHALQFEKMASHETTRDSKGAATQASCGLSEAGDGERGPPWLAVTA